MLLIVIIVTSLNIMINESKKIIIHNYNYRYLVVIIKSLKLQL